MQAVIALASAAPVGSGEQVPSLPATLHEKQVSLQALVQQRPSAQNPDPHCASAVHVVPFGFRPLLQAPAPSQYSDAAQVESRPPAATFTQLPSLPATAHDWHVPVHPLLQHLPSTQKPEPQSVAALQFSP
jgi:hypothetical protein